jgi:hypothetical protein
MPDKIIEFESKTEAISALKKFNETFLFPTNDLCKEEIIISSVASNIFRAFHLKNKKPSTIYREWASEVFEKILSDFSIIASKEDYYRFVFLYADSLIEKWSKETFKDEYLCYGPALKMVNLLVKVIQETDSIRESSKLKYQQVPFDSFSLIPLRFIINDLTNLKYRIIIPSNASMGFITTPGLYKIMMDSVYNLCELSNINPIVYDYWCWEDKHKNKNHKA